MRQVPVFLGLMVLSGWVCGQAADRLQSTACHDGLQALQTWDATASAPSQQREALRRRAAQACLGGPADAPLQRPRSAVAPITVAPVLPARARPALPTQTPPPAPAAGPRPPTVLTQCDSAGCWASDGTRLQRLGPDLVGPGGVCSQAGGVLHCP